MAKNKTQNLQLNSWVETDGVRREEFNENFQKIDTKIGSVDAQLAENVSDLKMRGVNVKYPPTPLIGVVGDGITDDTVAFQNIIDAYAGQDNISFLLPPKMLLREVSPYRAFQDRSCVKFTNMKNITIKGAPTTIIRDTRGEQYSFQFLDCVGIRVEGVYQEATSGVAFMSQPGDTVDMETGGILKFRACNDIKVSDLRGIGIGVMVALWARDIENGNEQMDKTTNFEIEGTLKNTSHFLSTNGAADGRVKVIAEGKFHRLLWLGNVEDAHFDVIAHNGATGSSAGIANISSNYQSNNKHERLSFNIKAEKLDALNAIRFKYSNLKNYSSSPEKVQRATVRDIDFKMAVSNVTQSISLEIDTASFETGAIYPLLENIKIIDSKLIKDRGDGTGYNISLLNNYRSSGAEVKNVSFINTFLSSDYNRTINLKGIENVNIINTQAINYESDIPFAFEDCIGRILLKDSKGFSDIVSNPAFTVVNCNADFVIDTFFSDTPRNISLFPQASNNTFSWRNIRDRTNKHTETLTKTSVSPSSGSITINTGLRYTLSPSTAQDLSTLTEDYYANGTKLTMIFTNANTTLKHSIGSLRLKGNVDVTPPANGVMEFTKISSLWYESARSF